MTAASPHSLDVSWSRLRTVDNITAYTVYYRAKGSHTTHNETVQVPVLRIDPKIWYPFLQTTLSGLRAYTHYVVSVSASSPSGEGPRSREVTSRTGEEGKQSDFLGPDQLRRRPQYSSVLINFKLCVLGHILQDDE